MPDGVGGNPIFKSLFCSVNITLQISTKLFLVSTGHGCLSFIGHLDIYCMILIELFMVVRHAVMKNSGAKYNLEN
jgi:hypothetical protein